MTEGSSPDSVRSHPIAWRGGRTVPLCNPLFAQLCCARCPATWRRTPPRDWRHSRTVFHYCHARVRYALFTKDLQHSHPDVVHIRATLGPPNARLAVKLNPVCVWLGANSAFPSRSSRRGIRDYQRETGPRRTLAWTDGRQCSPRKRLCPCRAIAASGIAPRNRLRASGPCMQGPRSPGPCPAVHTENHICCFSWFQRVPIQ